MRRVETLCLTFVAGLLVALGTWAATGSQNALAPEPTSSKPIMTEGTGPYKVIVEGDPGLPDHTIYRPENLKTVRGKIPIVSWANGGCANSSNSYRPFLSEIASHGFLVLAIGPAASVLNSPPPTPGGGPGAPGGRGEGRGRQDGTGGATRPPIKSSQLLDAIAWATAENSRSGSIYKGKIATNKVAVMGHSCGALEVFDVSTDPRVSTVVILSGGLPDWSNPVGITPGAPRVEKTILTKQHGAIAYFFGGPKDVAYNNCMDDLSKIQGVPAFGGSLTPALHQGTYAEPNGGEMGKVVVAWLEWQLQGEKGEKQVFVGESCELCKNPDWKVQQKELK